MKKTFLFGRLVFTVVLLAVFAVATMAQTNPKPGYVITNNGDTIRGVIDFRTNERLSKQCDFWAHGRSEGRTYKPGDIEGFRFDNNGKYFVTRRLNLDGEPQLYFAEFMVEGKMNLYCVADKYNEYFFFEREDGEMAQLTNMSLLTSSSLQDAKDDLQEKREQLGRVKNLLRDSWKAATGMSETDVSRKKLVNIVRDYHNDVCTDGSSCIVYEYREKSDRLKTHFKAFAGYAYYSHERTGSQNLGADENYSGGTFEIGLGVETDIERVMKGGSVEIGLAYSPKTSFEHDVLVRGGQEPSHTVYEKGRLTISLGVVKCFGKGRILPLVRGGGFYVKHFGNHETRYYKSKQIVDISWESTSHFGVYLGAGVQMAVGRHFARLHGDWYKSLESSSKGNMMKWGVTAEFAL
ncbi:MAG: hypothetical protein IKX33_08360 [Prevotella sp.]|nr:hypothetical protein [Prevotella sp.]